MPDLGGWLFDVRFASAQTAVPMLTEPTPTQRQAFELIGVPIPLTLRQSEQ